MSGEAPRGKPLGKFVLTERLGAGGMGEVWKAWDGATSRWVAIKRIRHADAELVRRFQREARLAAGLEHPNIAMLYEAGDAGGEPYLAMQFVKGRSLHGQQPVPREAARIVRDAALAVHFANERGIVHRDLKPANLMMDDAGRVYVMDFGLAREIASESSLSASGTAIGTPAYMPPEQAQGEIRSIDARSDVYSLGATLFELLTGRAPFEGRTAVSVLMAVVADEPPRPRRLDPGVSLELEAIVLRCLEKSRDRRYPTAKALADDLDRFMAGEAVSARPPSPAVRFIGRHRVLLGLALPLAIAVIVALGLLLRSRMSAQSAGDDVVARARQTAKSCLLAMHDLRRTARVDGLRRYADETTAAVEEALARNPSLGEPHSLLGQVLRAMMRFDEALAAQERALSLDGSLQDARYERAILTARELRRRMEDALRRSLQEAGRSADTAIRRSDVVVAQGEAERALDARLREDLAVLEKRALEPERLACVRGLAAWARGDRAAARVELTKAASLIEGIEALARLEFEENRLLDSIAVWTAGIERDRGYHPFLLGRAEAQSELGRHLAMGGRPHDEAFEAARADATAALALDEDLTSARLLRAAALMEQVRLGRDAGREVAAFEKAAEEDFDAVVRRRPAETEAWMGLGMLKMWRAHYADVAGRPSRDDSEAAVAALAKAVETAPADAMARRTLGAARRDLGELLEDDAIMQNAIEDALESTRLDPSAGNGWNELAVTRLTLGQRKFIRGGSGRELLEQALRASDEALKLMPRAPVFHRTRGIILSLLAQDRGETKRMERLIEAIASLEAGLKLSARDPLTWVTLARSRGLRADWLEMMRQDGSATRAQAIAEASEALQRNPRYPDALYERGFLRARQARAAMDGAADELYAGAVADFSALLEATNRRRGVIDRARTRLDWGLWRNARRLDASAIFSGAYEDFDHALRNGAGLDALIGRGRVLVEWSGTRTREAALEAAIADFTTALKRAPKYAPGYYFRAVAWGHLSSRRPADRAPVERGLSDLDEAIKLDPGYLYAYRQRGGMRILMAEHEPSRREALLKGAIEDLDRVATALPGDAGVYEMRGQAFEGSGDRPAALSDYERAIRLNPGAEARLRPRIDALRK